MTIFKISHATRSNPPKAAPQPRGDDAEVAAASRALVPVERISRTPPPRLHTTRPSTSFVAHLIATAEQLPQTRTLRRATSSDALTVYGRLMTRLETAIPDTAKLSRLA